MSIASRYRLLYIHSSMGKAGRSSVPFRPTNEMSGRRNENPAVSGTRLYQKTVLCRSVILSSGRSSAWLERLVWDQEAAGSNPVAPTMFYGYILQSIPKQRYYVGSTMDVANRLREHNSGESVSTLHGIPWELVHVEEFASRVAAVHWEKKIKAGGVARYLGALCRKPG